MLHNIALTKQWTETWPYIVNAVFRLVQNQVEWNYFRRFQGAISPISPSLGPALFLLHIYWVACANARFLRFKSWLWARTCTSYDTYSNSLLHSQRSTGLFVCKTADTFLSYFIILTKACSTYRIGRLCNMPSLPETSLLRILLVLYINFQLLENKWRNSRSQNALVTDDVIDRSLPSKILDCTTGKLKLVLSNSDPQWLRVSQGRLCDLDLMGKGAFLWNLTGKGWIY